MLWLDDNRPPKQYGFWGATWVKTAEDCISHISKNHPDFVSLYHDLAWEHQPGSGIEPSQYNEKTGYSVVCWMEETETFPKKVQIHSANPVGKARMCQVLSKYYNHKQNIIIGWGHEAVLFSND